MKPYLVFESVVYLLTFTSNKKAAILHVRIAARLSPSLTSRNNSLSLDPKPFLFNFRKVYTELFLECQGFFYPNYETKYDLLRLSIILWNPHHYDKMPSQRLRRSPRFLKSRRSKTSCCGLHLQRVSLDRLYDLKISAEIMYPRWIHKNQIVAF